MQQRVLLALGWIALAACASSRTQDAGKPDASATTMNGATLQDAGHTGPIVASDAAPAAAASDAQAGAAPPDAEVPDAQVVIGTTEPLLAPRFAFKAGLHDAETVWLMGSDGEPRPVPTGDVNPRYADSCGISMSTGNYEEGSGRFGPLVFDPSGRYLLFVEVRECSFPGGPGRSRVLAYELATGTTRILLEATNRTQLTLASGGVSVLVDHQGGEPRIEVFRFIDGALESIPVTVSGLNANLALHARLERLGDSLLLFLDHVPPLERVDGVWRQSTLFDELGDLDHLLLTAATAAPSGTALCGATTHIDDSGGAGIDSAIWVVGPDRHVKRRPIDDPFYYWSCLWSPDETRVAFASTSLVFDVASFMPISPPAGTSASLEGQAGDVLYGWNDDRQAVRVEWASLAAHVVPELESLPAVCPNGYQEGGTSLLLPPDDRDVVILKASCGCIDCDISGSLYWNRASGAVEIIEEAFGEHAIYDYVWPADGSAVLLSTQGKTDDEGGREHRPADGAFFSISGMRGVETVGPLEGPVGPLHGSVAPPAH